MILLSTHHDFVPFKKSKGGVFDSIDICLQEVEMEVSGPIMIHHDVNMEM